MHVPKSAKPLLQQGGAGGGQTLTSCAALCEDALLNLGYRQFVIRGCTEPFARISCRDQLPSGREAHSPAALAQPLFL